MTLGVKIWLFNDEFLIRDCVQSILKVFDQAVVYDLGSTDSSLERIKDLNIPIRKLGRINGRDYIQKKNEINSKFNYIFNIDGDEIYPEDSLLLLKEIIFNKRPDSISGFWKMLRFNRVGKLFLSSSYIHPDIAWNTKKYFLARSWPNETLYPRNPSPGKLVRKWFNDILSEDIYCYHGVLLPRSSVYDKNRSIKLKRRENEFKDLTWEKIDKLPWK